MFAYSRAQAIADGVRVEATKTATDIDDPAPVISVMMSGED